MWQPSEAYANIWVYHRRRHHRRSQLGGVPPVAAPTGSGAGRALLRFLTLGRPGLCGAAAGRLPHPRLARSGGRRLRLFIGDAGFALCEFRRSCIRGANPGGVLGEFRDQSRRYCRTADRRSDTYFPSAACGAFLHRSPAAQAASGSLSLCFSGSARANLASPPRAWRRQPQMYSTTPPPARRADRT